MERNKKILFSPPVLKEKNIEERWYFAFNALLPAGKKERVKVSCGINRGKTVEERRSLASQVLSTWDPWKYYKGAVPDIVPVPAGKSETLIIAIEQFFKDQITWKLRTKQTYRTILNDFYRWLRLNQCSNLCPVGFTSDHAHRYTRFLQESSYSNVTFNSRKAFLFSIWDHWRIYKPKLQVNRNPWEAIRTLPDTKIPKKIFTPAEKAMLKEFITKQYPDLMFFIEYAYYSFLRPPSEIRGLKVGDHDFNNYVINVTATNSKTNLHRVHPIPTVFQNKLKHLVGIDGNHFVFGRNGGTGPEPLPKNRMIDLHRKVLDRFGFSKQYALYSWRHTAACELYLKTHDIKLVQMAMGHSSVATTERYLRNLGVLNDPRLFDRSEL